MSSFDEVMERLESVKIWNQRCALRPTQQHQERKRIAEQVLELAVEKAITAAYECGVETGRSER